MCVCARNKLCVKVGAHGHRRIREISGASHRQRPPLCWRINTHKHSNRIRKKIQKSRAHRFFTAFVYFTHTHMAVAVANRVVCRCASVPQKTLLRLASFARIARATAAAAVDNQAPRARRAAFVFFVVVVVVNNPCAFDRLLSQTIILGPRRPEVAAKLFSQAISISCVI